MYPVGRYNLNFNISASLIAAVLVIFCIMKKNMRKRTSVCYVLMISFLGLASVSETITLVMLNDPNGINYLFGEVTASLTHLLHGSVPYLFQLYVVAHFHISKKRKDAAVMLLTAVPEIILILLVLVAPLRRLCWIVNVAGSGSIEEGVLYPYFFFTAAFYILCALFTIIRNRRVFRSEAVCMLVYIGGVILSRVIDYFHPHMQMTYLIEVLCLLLTYLVLENDGVNTDIETGAYNRYAFHQDMNIIFGTDTEATVIAVKTQTLHYNQMIFGAENAGALQRSIYLWLKERFGKDARIYYTGRGNYVLLACRADGADTQAIMEEILARFRQKWKGKNVDLMIAVQILVADIPEKVVNYNQLSELVYSDFNAKLGEGRISVVDSMHEQLRRNAVERAICRALEEHTLSVYYQPIYDTRTRQVHSAEALVRMNDPEIGFVPPAEFIPIAEQNGTIGQIGAFVFEEVCRFIRDHAPGRFGIDFLEINLSTVQCMDDRLPERFEELMQRYQIPHSMINLEITETALYYNESEMLQVVTALQNRGFRFSLDDFGTGYANYSYMVKFPFSLIKIDKSFLWAAEENVQNSRLLTHMIQMAKDMDLKTVVEGVETDLQRTSMEEQNVDYLQGYLFSKPVSEQEFLAYLESLPETL